MGKDDSHHWLAVSGRGLSDTHTHTHTKASTKHKHRPKNPLMNWWNWTAIIEMRQITWQVLTWWTPTPGSFVCKGVALLMKIYPPGRRCGRRGGCPAGCRWQSSPGPSEGSQSWQSEPSLAPQRTWGNTHPDQTQMAFRQRPCQHWTATCLSVRDSLWLEPDQPFQSLSKQRIDWLDPLPPY